MEKNTLETIKEFFKEEEKDPFGGTIGREWSKPDYMLRFISERTPNDLFVVNCGLERCSPYKTANFGRVWFYSIHYVVSGHGWIEYDGEKRYLGADDVFFLTPSVQHKYYPDVNDPWTYISVEAFGSLASFVDSIVGVPHRLIFHADENSGLKEDFFRLEKSVFKTGKKSFQTTGLLYLFLDKLYRLFGRKEERENDGLNDYVHLALDYIRSNYRSLTVKDIAENCHVSPEHLSRVCKKELGYTLKELLTVYRLQLALDYLKSSFLSEAEIADLIGYSGGKYFKSVFSSVFDKTPEEYRKELKIIKDEERKNNE